MGKKAKPGKKPNEADRRYQKKKRAQRKVRKERVEKKLEEIRNLPKIIPPQPGDDDIRGRPSSYKPEYDEQVFKYCLLGADDTEIALFFGITVETLNHWKVEFPSFFESIKMGKEDADAEVAHKLYERARGMTFIEQEVTKVKKVVYENGKKKAEMEEVVLTPVERQVLPDPQCIGMFLRNRQHLKWNREKLTVEHTGKDGKKIETETTVIHATPAEAQKAYNDMLKGR